MAQLESLPPEIALHILTFLSIPDLLSLSRTSHTLRALALDPVLHTQRLYCASQSLEYYLSQRPSLDTLRPPNRSIYLTRTHLLARSISRSLITIRLNRNLFERPSSIELVVRGILPKECTSYDSPISPALFARRQSFLRERLRNALGRKLQRRPSVASLVELNILPEECTRKGGNAVAPGLVERRRRVIRESLKDGLRVWVERRAVLVQRRKEEGEKEGLGVKGLVRRFTRRMLEEKGEAEAGVGGLQRQKRKAQARWGREAEIAKRWEEERREMLGGGCSQPTRAHVLGLKRFWEGVTKAAAG
ncbi:hypothetical protein EPUS_09007 [Endocarpon pusillum Z07020]|uniref:F-box domain-containing protein n=1 Tax=Endocarpon pusillum (strain Z07020 / HMAS-L-300199) TaxID=1263415 RepID=U1GWQ9_ENDPU|nr:uncharacterized protein EPUS_09007 [Endocarpon pusillum Z07020]ERF76526.1 hypothetical protein EPUS_09007 [Endocarpon pusillum Z07020]